MSASDKKSLYTVLEVSPQASTKEIKAAFMKKGRSLSAVKVYHPDRAKDKFKPEVFKEILEAYQTLSDPIKKSSYDLGLANPAFSEQDLHSYTDNIKNNNYSETFYNNK